MNREDIIRMARESGFHAWYTQPEEHPEHVAIIERFAALVAAAERERFMQTVQSMKAELEAKFEKTYMEGAMAGATAEREACAKVAECFEPTEKLDYVSYASRAIRARKENT